MTNKSFKTYHDNIFFKQNVIRYVGTSLFKLVEELLDKVLWTDRQTDGQKDC